MNKRRIIWIELLRIFACIGVIGIHAASQHFRDVPVNTSVWAVTNFYHGINRFAVACFVMISGCLYLCGRAFLTYCRSRTQSRSGLRSTLRKRQRISS